MALPVLFAFGIAWLAVNVSVSIWLAPRWVEGRTSGRQLALVMTAVRYLPLIGAVIYAAAIGGEWWLILFVAALAASGFWMLDGLIGYTERIGGREELRKIREYQERARHKDD